jgi:hypothetical protein
MLELFVAVAVVAGVCCGMLEMDLGPSLALGFVGYCTTRLFK